MSLWPKELERVDIPVDKAAVVISRLRPLLKMWPVHVHSQLLEQLALSAYTQGLIDAEQLFRKVTR